MCSEKGDLCCFPKDLKEKSPLRTEKVCTCKGPEVAPCRQEMSGEWLECTQHRGRGG